GADLTVLMMDEVQQGETFDGVPVRPSLLNHAMRVSPRPMRLLYALYLLVATWLAVRFAALRRRAAIGRALADHVRMCRETDLVVCVGGGYLRGVPTLASTVLLVLLLHPLMLHHHLGTPVVLYTQSVGPFANRAQRWLARRALSRVDLVLAREDTSVSVLASLGVTDNVRRSVDCGFAFHPDADVDLRAWLGIPEATLLVGITVRQWLDARGQARYEQAVAEVADVAVAEFGATVVFLPQVTSERQDDDDRRPSLRVAGRMAQPAIVLTGRYDHRTIKAMYGAFDLLVGTRFHSVIFAMTSLVPALAIEYEHKTSGIMRDLGLDEWVHPISTADGAHLSAALRELVVRRERVAAELAQRLPDYQQQAMRTKWFLLEVVGRARVLAAPGSEADGEGVTVACPGR
ncbi:MAG: polysaccharide pyruvyl transferase family protein, partial [Micromonosporaceae bacterium]|nr:polysaccharide pyruvyl transferase family protein [Micromonosporaceae bacterium]